MSSVGAGPGSCSPLLSRTLELQAWSARRASAARWSLFNGTLLLVFVADLWCKCECYTSVLHLVEYAMSAVLACNLVVHVSRLLPSPPSRAHLPPLPITQQQQRLLGLSDSQLDSSFRVVNTSSFSLSAEEPGGGGSGGEPDETSLLSLSLSRSWATGGEESGAAGAGAGAGQGGAGAGAGGSPRRSPDTTDDRFIADTDSLTDYLRAYESRRLAGLDASRGPSPPLGAGAGVPPVWGPPAWGSCVPAVSPPRYQLASIDTESSSCEASGMGGAMVGAGLGAGGAGAEGGGGAAPHVWRQLHIDPTQLMQYNFNLRLWLHMTIVSRVAAALQPLEQWAGGAGAGAGGAGAGGAAVARYLQPAAQRYYVAQRVVQLARRPALSNYRWDRGGSDWDHTKPTDAEIIMHLFATYVDSQVPFAKGGGGEGGAFSSRHLSRGALPGTRGGGGGTRGGGGGGAARGGGTGRLCIHRCPGSPPHYLLVTGEEAVEVARGRNNLLYTLLVFLAAAAAAARGGRGGRGGWGGEGPAGLQLGPAGLNLLWVIGR